MKVAYTISTANYLFLAKTVGDSFLKHNPDYQFTIFLYDKVNNRFDVSFFFPLKITEIENLHLPAFSNMVNRYSIFEMCNALKPFVAEHILLNSSVETLVYLDSDLMFYDSLRTIHDALENANIIITPHVNTPMPLDGCVPDEKSLLIGGIYNGGFFALKPCTESFAFLNWWKAHLEKNCFVNYAEGLFVDQKWLNLAPLYFEVVILRHPGYNIGHWNLHERVLENVQEKHSVNKSYPLVFFHFSGYDIFSRQQISKYQDRFSFASRPDLIDLFDNYKAAVLKNEPKKFSEFSCYYTEIKQKNEALVAAHKQLAKKNKGKLFSPKIKSKIKSILNLKN